MAKFFFISPIFLFIFLSKKIEELQSDAEFPMVHIQFKKIYRLYDGKHFYLQSLDFMHENMCRCKIEITSHANRCESIKHLTMI